MGADSRGEGYQEEFLLHKPPLAYFGVTKSERISTISYKNLLEKKVC